jgi:hypothetical protein
MATAKVAKSLVNSLTAEANKVDPRDFILTTPLHVLLGEAVDVARFCEHNWEPVFVPKTETLLRPGLKSAGKKQIERLISEEILVLQQLVQEAHTAYLLAVKPSADASVTRAQFVVDELASALEWLFDDGVTDERDAQLATIVEAHRDDPDSEDALAGELADYLGLAMLVKDDLAELAAFDIALLGEARSLVAVLRDRSALRARANNTESAILIERRNRFAALLSRRMARVRAAARYVYRQHPDIVKQVTSAYERRRRAARRRANQIVEPEAPVAPAPTPVITAPTDDLVAPPE